LLLNHLLTYIFILCAFACEIIYLNACWCT